MLSTSKIEEVPQTCFDFDVVRLKNLRTSGRIASFPRLQKDRQTDRQADRQTDRQTDRQLQLPLHYTATTTTNAYIVRYITLH